MPLSIRDPRAAHLARELAARRGTNMTEAIIAALEAAIAQNPTKPPLAERLTAIGNALMTEARPGGHRLTKDDIDALWGG